jgi:hypothetical protein
MSLLISRAVMETEVVEVIQVAAIAAAAHALEATSALLHGAELLEELAPADDAFFAALETVGAVKAGEVGGGCIAVG